MSSNQTITFTTPPVVTAIKTSVNQLPNSLTSNTVQANKITVGGVRIINPPNRVYQSS